MNVCDNVTLNSFMCGQRSLSGFHQEDHLNFLFDRLIFSGLRDIEVEYIFERETFDISQIFSKKKKLSVENKLKLKNSWNWSDQQNANLIFASKILQHYEFSFLLKDRVCPLIIKLFSPSLKYRQGVPTPAATSATEKPYFPIVMRLLRIVAVLITHYYTLMVSTVVTPLSSHQPFLLGWDNFVASF